MTYRLVPEDELLGILASEAELDCLEANGVKTWAGYMTNKNDFIEEAMSYNSNVEKSDDQFDFKDVAKLDIRRYPTVTLTYEK